MKFTEKDLLLGMMTATTNNQHDGSACLVANGVTLGCFEEERYIRYKHAIGHLPINAIAAALRLQGASIRDVAGIFVSAAKHPDIFARIKLYLEHYFGHAPEITGIHHQEAHLASAFYPSGFDEAMLISFDGLGDFESMVTAVGRGADITVLERKGVPQSLGIYYQTLTQYLGFSGVGDEYKVMGLSAFGKPGIDLSSIIEIREEDYHIKAEVWERDPPSRNLLEPRFGRKLIDLHGPARLKGVPLSQRERDFAYAIQDNFEKAVLAVVKGLHRKTGLRKLGLAGGCALNCLTNMKILDLDFIDELFVQPAATDQGSALGAALLASARGGIKPGRIPHYYLGSEYGDEEIRQALTLCGVRAYSKPADLPAQAAASLAAGKIIGLYHGRSEFGPRALDNRSILANPAIADIKGEINRRIKFREEFRPFAPAVLAESANEVFEMKSPSPFMTITSRVREPWKKRIPGVVHVDGTSRVQSVARETNPRFYDVISAFHKATGVPLVVNTSFNVMGEPVVETPMDAIKTFYGCGLDELFLGDYWIKKA